MSDETNPTQEPWHKDGLNFTCTQCGNCCTGAPGVVWVGEEELQGIAEYLDKPIGEIRLFHTRLVHCTFFDPEKRHCKVYPVRPIQCQTWPFWTSNVSTEEKWNEVCETCPGAGQGAFFSLEEIEARASRMSV
jgi:uncharacterized protein